MGFRYPGGGHVRIVGADAIEILAVDCLLAPAWGSGRLGLHAVELYVITRACT